MKRISTLTSNPYQIVTFITESGLSVKLTFRYLATQQRWSLDLESDKLSVYGLFLSCYPNILDKWHNILDFGINVKTTEGLDPFELTAFEEESCIVCVLNNDEKEQATEYLDGLL